MYPTLIVPELIWPEPEDREAFDDAGCPALRALLGRSRFERHAPQSFEATLCEAFGLPEAVAPAPLRRLGEPDRPSDAAAGRTWICADPVHLRYHEELLILADAGSFALTLEEARSLADALNTHFAELGHFEVAAPTRWYLRPHGAHATSQPETADVPPRSTVAGRALDHERPVTAAQKALHRLLTEIQMLLHAHPVNQQREAAGQLPINSLWLWGGGSLPEAGSGGFQARFDALLGQDALALGLARYSGIPTLEAAGRWEDGSARAAPGSRPCIVLEDLLNPVQYEKREAYRDALADLESRWFAPLHAALRSGRVKQLRIVAPTAYGRLTWECRPVDRWAFWKRPIPLAGLAKTLAAS